jgi:iron complex transport system substrate-binding protein
MVTLQKKWLIPAITAAILCIVIFLYAVQTTGPVSLQTVTVTDLAGRTVQIPTDVHAIACIAGPSYERVFLVGGASKIALITPFVKGMPWAMKVIPGLSDKPTLLSEQDPNVEDLLKRNISLAFFWDYQKPIDKMTAAGIPVIVSTQIVNTEAKPHSIEEFRNAFKKDIRIFGTALGPDSQKKAEAYCQYFDEKADRILAVTSTIPESERPKVFYAGGPSAQRTQGQYTYTHWLVEMAGGSLVSKNVSQQKFDATMEQVMVWNPDIILMGRMNSTATVLNDPKWKEINAVKTGKVYLSPEGVFYWDYSSEGILLLEYMAKTFHPDKFPDLDMKKEVKDYYTQFYTYSLSDEEADRILRHMPPL